MTMVTEPVVARRRAIEALRAGVPSRDAVATLGSGQTAIEDRFASLRESAVAGTPGGLLLGGGFGAGKSHLLEHLASLALADGCVVSRVVISKETPLYDPAKVFRAAADSAVTAAGGGPAIAEAAAQLDVEGRSYLELLRWAASAGADLNERFPATLELFGQVRDRDPEVADTIVRFWSGDPIRTPDLRRHLKQIGHAKPVLPPVRVPELARQRLRFAAKLLATAGYGGWVVLFDEVELIGRYSLLQRARSYAEVARWVRGEFGAAGVPIAAVLAMTDDFEAAVITGKDDREQVPAKLRAKDTPEAGELASAAEIGMRLIDREMILLQPAGSGRAGPGVPAAQAAARRGVRVAAAGRGRPGAAGRQPDAAVRARLDQRVGPGPARPGLPAGHRNRGRGFRLPGGRDAGRGAGRAVALGMVDGWTTVAGSTPGWPAG